MRRLLRPVHHCTQLLLPASLLLVSGCVSMSYTQDPLERYMTQQQPAEALKALEQEKTSSRDQALYHLNKAVLLRMEDNFADSNAELESAKQISEKLDAVSIREQAAAVSVNDSMRSYLPPPFEQVMLYCLKMLNYLQLNRFDDARVEALQLDVYLKQTPKDEKFPFARYLSGLVFETQHELSDALIAYRQAYNGYHAVESGIPLQLQMDLLRLTEQQGLKDEHRRYLEEFKLDNWPHQADLDRQGEYIAIVFSGLVPRKHETSISVQDPRSGQLHRISIPFYEQRQSQVANMNLIGLNQTERGEHFARLDRQANVNLTEQMPGIIARTVARVAVKNKLSDDMRDKNPLLGVITNVAGFILEQADTRGWNSLPQEILLSRLPLPPGDYDIVVNLASGTQTTIASKTIHQVSLQQKQKRFFSWHWPASTMTSKEYRNANTTYSTTVRYRLN